MACACTVAQSQLPRSVARKLRACQVSACTNVLQVAAAVSALWDFYPHGLLVFHEPAGGAYRFTARCEASYVTALQALHVFNVPRGSWPKVMLYTEPAGSACVGHYEACVPCSEPDLSVPEADVCHWPKPAMRGQGAHDVAAARHLEGMTIARLRRLGVPASLAAEACQRHTELDAAASWAFRQLDEGETLLPPHRVPRLESGKSPEEQLRFHAMRFTFAQRVCAGRAGLGSSSAFWA